jgi:hypothetical protein
MSARVRKKGPVVRYWCVEPGLSTDIERALEGAQIDVAECLDASDLERVVSEASCCVVGLCSPPSDSTIALLHQLDARAAERLTTLSWPMIIVDDHSILERLSLSLVIRHGTMSREWVARLLVIEIQRECARAALRFGILRVRAAAGLHATLADALVLALRGDPAAVSVKSLALLAQCRPRTLHEYWNAEVSTAVGLKHFVDVVLLLAARARKTPQLTWDDVADEYGTDVKHLRAVAHREIGFWPRRRGGASAWITLADRFRQEAAGLFPARP